MSARTITVPEAGKRYFGLSRNGSYDAAKRGEIPTIKIGRLFKVPVALMEEMMGAEPINTVHASTAKVSGSKPRVRVKATSQRSDIPGHHC